MIYESSLCHHGVKGQKWRIRRYQNKDGSLTALGRIRYLKSSKSSTASSTKTKNQPKKEQTKKTVSEMTDDEIRNAINRKRLEKEYQTYFPEKVSTGKKFVTRLTNKVLQPALEDAGKKILTDMLVKIGNQAVTDAAKQIQKQNTKK